jgi:uncharacterized membrane protein YjjB (DUF3815 family)
MAFKCVKGFDQSQPMYCGTSSSVTEGSVVVFDVSTGAAVSPVIPATSLLLGCNVAGVAVKTPAAADTTVPVIPIVPGQLWEYDCTNATASGQLGKLNDLTNATTVANSTTISTAATAFVRNIEVVSSSKMRGYIVGSQSPKALS